MFVDGDDCLKKDIVQTLVDNIGNNDITICSYTAFNDEDSLSMDCSFFNGDRDFGKDKTDLFLQLINLSYGQKGKPYTAVGVPWGKLYKKSFLEEHSLRFDKKLIRMQDNIFNMQAVSSYLNDEIFERYKGCQNFISKRSVIISIYMKLGRNIFTYLIAKYVKF